LTIFFALKTCTPKNNVLSLFDKIKIKTLFLYVMPKLPSYQATKLPSRSSAYLIRSDYAPP
jgi:hypothetical protein